MLIVQKVPGANTLEVTKGVEEAMDDMKPGLPGIQVHDGLFRPATFIDMALDNLIEAMLLGILLVILILAAFLFEWRTAFISLIAIPLSLVGALVVLEMFGTVINVMILAGLVVAIGVVVDDAIIDVENIVRRLRQARAEGREVSTFKVVLDASVEVRSAIIYATLIDVCAIVPVFFLSGLSGSFFQPLVLAYGLAVLVVDAGRDDGHAGTVPAAALEGTQAEGVAAHAGAEARLRRSSGRRHAQAASRRSLTAAAVIGAGLLVYPTLGQSLLPNFKENDLITYWATKPGTSLRGDDADLEPGLQGLPRGDPGGREVLVPHRARRCSATRSTA